MAHGLKLTVEGKSPTPIRATIPGREWMKPHRWIWKDEDILQPTSLLNLRTMIEYHPVLQGMFIFNEFTAEILITRGLPGDRRNFYPRPIQDEDEADLAAWLNMNGLSAGIQNTGAMIRAVAFRYSVNPLSEWLRGLEWDGTARVSSWLATYCGAEATTYHATVGRKFFISAVARALDPGCKCDTMPVFEGPQGLRKSTMIEVIAGKDYYGDQIGDISSKDAQGMIQGKWLIEVPELDKFSRKEAETIKDFLSRKEDKYRPPYGRNFIKRPRRCVFFGTINPELDKGYIKDATGARRFWPIECTRMDIRAMERDRAQLWAEAVSMWSEGQTWWIDDDEFAVVRDTQEERIDQDVWLSAVRAWMHEREGAFTPSQILSGAVNLDLSRQDQAAKNRLSKILTSLKCEPDKKYINGVRSRVYRLPKNS